ncbi:hypothetical protein RQN30_07460 [Arcanobacterium hippocoleae]
MPGKVSPVRELAGYLPMYRLLSSNLQELPVRFAAKSGRAAQKHIRRQELMMNQENGRR